MSNVTEKQATSAREATPQDATHTHPASEHQRSQEDFPQEPVLLQEASPAEPLSAEPEEPPAWERLRRAREQRQLEQADIAAELRLDLSLVNALEEGNFSKLPEPVYTAGYVRAYARLMDLPPDDIVAKYTNINSDHKTSVSAGREKIPARYSQVTTALPKSFSVAVSRGDSKILRYVIILVCLIALLVIVWQVANNKTTDSVPINPTSLENDVGLNQQTTQTQLKVVDPEPVADIVESPVEPEQFTTKSVKLAIPNQGRSSIGVAGATINGEEGGAVDSQRLALNNALPPIESISLHFSKNSWIDIRDATGKRLIRRLGLAGASKTVTGEAPFEVLIGYGPGVKMEYNGQPFDFSSFQGKRVARFTLDGVVLDGAVKEGDEEPAPPINN